MRPEVTSSKSPMSRRGLVGLAAIAAGAALVWFLSGEKAGKPARISAEEAHLAAQAGEIILVDIRTPEEWGQTGIGDGAVALDMRAPSFAQTIVTLQKARPGLPIALICRTGNRSSYAIRALGKAGVTGLVDVAEGMAGGPNGKGWLKKGLPTYPGTRAQITERLNAALS